MNADHQTPSERLAASRFRLMEEFEARHDRPPDDQEMSEICDQAFKATGIAKPVPRPLSPEQLKL